MGVRLDGRSA